MRYTTILFAVVVVGAGCTDSGSSPNQDAASDAGNVEPDAAPVPGCAADDPFEWPAETGDIEITPSAAWKNQIAVTDDPFLSTSYDPDAIRWIKFAVLVGDPSKVYFQDGATYLFHYDFATAHLDPFEGMDRAEFDQVALHEAGQQVILGAVLFPPRPEMNELAIQLVRQQPYHPEMARQVIDLVVQSIDGAEGRSILYFPTFEQSESATACTTWFADQGIVVGAADRWLTDNACYSNGWALGKLVSVPGAEIASAYAAGTLAPTDVLLTDMVPAEIPFVAGILAKRASTPNSHVAILARSYGVPFAHLTADNAARADTLVGKEVVLRAYSGIEGCDLRLVDVDGMLPAGDRAEILALKTPPDLSIQPIASFGAYSASTTGLTEADVRYFGGKATGFGLLRAAIPEASPQAIAISFDLWTEFLDQTLPSGGSLREQIAARLSGFEYPPNMAAVDQALAEVRALILTEADFTSAQQQAMLTALAGFDPDRKVRFRSSTNVEDTDQFVGAGLYNSYSGCVADDEDTDDLGPSLCDASRAEERGAFLAIRRVYASFYNTNAFLERLRYGVDESQVGMALLVHHSFPDEIELANGVATGSHTSYSTLYDLVTQAGAVSVSNPEGGAAPERVEVYAGGFGIYPTLLEESSLVPLGGTVMDWPTEYEALAVLLKRVDDLYAARHPELDRFMLDYEYKKVDPGDLVVKQVRRLPQPDPDATWPVYLVNEPRRFCVFQGEITTAFANHRLKSIWQVATHNRWLTPTTLEQSFYADIDLEYLDDTTQANLAGDPTTWPGAGHSFDGDRVFDSFTIGAGPDRRDYTMEVSVDTEVPVTRPPLRLFDDHWISIRVDYATPVPTIDWTGPTTTSSEYISLGTCPQDNVVTSVNQLAEETITAGDITVDTAYYFPEHPRVPVAGYTAPLYQWKETTITGLASEPILLTGYYSQTYRPGHHNFGNDFIFDPWLEPDVSTIVLDELQAKNIRFLYIEYSNQMYILGLDNTLRRVE